MIYHKITKSQKHAIFIALLSLLAFASCDKVDSFTKDNEELFSQFRTVENDAIKVTDIEFSSDYKTFTITADVVRDVGEYELADSVHVRTEVLEVFDFNRKARWSVPRLMEIRNIEAERIRQDGLKMLVLVDLTLPQNDLDSISNAVGMMQNSFNSNNLYLAFMNGDTVSATIGATDYVLDNYFVHSPADHVRLYRSIIEKRDEMLSGEGVWRDTQKRVLLTFSNEKVYRDGSDEPIDRDHFQLQEEMTGYDTTVVGSDFYSYYASCDHKNADVDNNADNIIRIFCNSTGGEYVEDFVWTPFKHAMYADLGYVFPDNEFVFENPDMKVYRGDSKKLILNFYNRETDSLLASMSKVVVMGELFNPVIVHGHDLKYVLLQGFSLSLILVIVLYFVMQFIIPAIKHAYFLRKYVVRYRNGDMSFGNMEVAKSCYLCKAPFEKGDRIVVKCEHTMHKSCWDENGYHCPEYSDRCKHGSHYYNSVNLFDHRNASFRLKWFLASIISAFTAWLAFSLIADYGLYNILYKAHTSVTQPPLLGLVIGFFYTMCFSELIFRQTLNIRANGLILLRSLIAAIGSYIPFVVVNIVIYYFHIERFSFLLTWIPWTVMAFLIIECISFMTRVNRSKLLLLVTVLLGFLSMFAWNHVFLYTELDFRVLLLISFVIYGIGLAACIATVMPRTERYFLKVQGAVKGMDIALYKWFRNNPGRVVSIGRSVDCALQLSWDIQGDVAPVQAEIRKGKRFCYLVPLEQGVYMRGKPLRPGKKKVLYHGRSFTIGQTTFTYVEKDR